MRRRVGARAPYAHVRRRQELAGPLGVSPAALHVGSRATPSSLESRAWCQVKARSPRFESFWSFEEKAF